MTDLHKPPPPDVGRNPYEASQRRCLTAESGEEIAVRPACDTDFHGVCGLYDDFEPKQSAQGLPPAKQDVRRDWVRRLMGEPINALAEVLTTVVGHACLLDVVPGERSELAIMIHQDWRNQGIGSALLELTIELARRASYKSIWLTVSIQNTRALHVYRKCGFRQCDRIDIEIEMERLL